MSDTKISAQYQAVTQDLDQLVKDAKLLFEEATTMTGEKANDTIRRGIDLLEQGKARLHRTQASLMESGKDALKCTDDYVIDHPLRSIGMAAGVGLLVGYLISRK